jgi:HNH endonuclease
MKKESSRNSSDSLSKMLLERGLNISWPGLSRTLRDPSRILDLRRFAQFIKASGDCWEWTGSTIKGYPRFNIGWRPVLVYYGHRCSYFLFKGDIPKGMIVMHGCDNPLCVNPSHLSVGTTKDNQHDSRNKGRATVGSKSHHAKLSEADVLPICERRASGETLASIAASYGVHFVTIWQVVSGNKWKHVPRVSSIDEGLAAIA